jgi:phytol kinase
MGIALVSVAIFTAWRTMSSVALILTILAVFIILVSNEVWWRHRAPHDEFSRKFVHITVGSFVAFWPFFLTWHQIELLSLAFLLVVGVSKYLGVFQAIHSVQRPTWGEFYFAIAVGVVALITHDKWIYAAALLQMSLADGLAAVVGTRFGGKHKYIIFGHTKSLIGTLTFAVVSLGVLFATNQHISQPVSTALLLVSGVVAALLENVAVMGMDNLLVPVLVALLLAHA